MHPPAKPSASVTESTSISTRRGASRAKGALFNRIEFISPYACFDSVGEMYTTVGSVLLRLTYLEYNLLDLNTAEHIILTKKRFRQLAADDAALLSAFEEESRKYDKLPEYLRRYTQTLM